jgi:hypothetical protein
VRVVMRKGGRMSGVPGVTLCVAGRRIRLR